MVVMDRRRIGRGRWIVKKKGSEAKKMMVKQEETEIEIERESEKEEQIGKLLGKRVTKMQNIFGRFEGERQEV